VSPPRSPIRRDPARTVRFRRRALLAFWLICGIGLTARSVELQLLQGAQWRAEAERQHRTTGEIPAARGAILDRDGVPLALSHETFRVSVAPHEVRDTTATVDQLVESMGISSPQALQAFQTTRRWVTLSGRYPPATRDALEGLRGVYVERELRRFYPHGELLRGLLGSVIDEAGAGGVEQQFDEHLRGTPGLEVLSRDSEGRPIPGESWMVEAPRSGGQVILTLDADLQEIASEALREAIETTGARGGELLVTEPGSGEILAMVSVKDGATTHLGSINTPFEPGSTLKPFTVATLLHAGKASLADTVDTGSGQWRVAGRTITDVASPGRVDLAHALRVSSNVGVAKVAQRLSAAEQYEHLRDFGFGVPTGVDLPGEVGGTLRRPQQWTGQSPASLAIGYEISVTPLQMAMAYGALANGGTLMEPRLIREVRDPAGRAVERHEPRAVRQVVSREVAGEVTRALVDAVEDGTGGRARLATFAVAGKSGTSRAYGENGGYEAGGYYASFVGFFPAEDPQLVVFVKLDRPRGEYYGGATAAPVTRATMEAVLAAHRSPLDRRALAAIARSRALPTPAQPSFGGAERGPTHENGIAREMTGPEIDGAPLPRFVARPDVSGTPAGGDPRPQAVPDEGLLLPDLTGLPLRTAVRRLHGMGLSVLWEGGEAIGGTRPGAGTVVSPGDTIRILPASPGRAPPGAGRGVDDDD
jgi:cell division protein FtsI (penicillin-binding protein 3)